MFSSEQYKGHTQAFGSLPLLDCRTAYLIFQGSEISRTRVSSAPQTPIQITRPFTLSVVVPACSKLEGAMAGRTTWLLILSTAFAGLVACVSAHIKCEDLPINACAFSVSSSGMRCILEKVISTEGQAAYQCQTSEVLATEFAEWVETDECVSSCGLDRMTVGMS
ncbi:hypothetical protein KP509_31G019400 [Ceratopteris richardii]|uniref:Uncharacterized protein n=1 Tax=Ceratopteris richardii TaxID=49495 RepID=A0A8T2QWA3_CERRI|nr:hypothetical protein KP509_31G019400 [Ceratopteris richardii]